MSVFVPLDIKPYKKSNPPADEKSLIVYYDTQLRELEKANTSLIAALKQAQDEFAIVWSVIARP